MQYSTLHCRRRPSDTLQNWYVRLSETFTVWHLDLLAIVADTPKWLDQHGLPVRYDPVATAFSLAMSTFSYLGAPRGMYEICAADLAATGLIQANSAGFKYDAPRLTPLGMEFLRFITSPIPELDNADKPMS